MMIDGYLSDAMIICVSTRRLYVNYRVHFTSFKIPITIENKFQTKIKFKSSTSKRNQNTKFKLKFRGFRFGPHSHRNYLVI
jgi:hypothetical protein